MKPFQFDFPDSETINLINDYPGAAEKDKKETAQIRIIEHMPIFRAASSSFIITVDEPE